MSMQMNARPAQSRYLRFLDQIAYALRSTVRNVELEALPERMRDLSLRVDAHIADEASEARRAHCECPGSPKNA